MHCNNLLAIAIALFLINGNVGSRNSFFASAQPFSCGKECYKFGNCNQETGECECPFGRIGKHCHKDQLSACHLSPTGPAYCDGFTLQSCECLAQCQDYLCPDGVCDTLSDLGPHRVCYSREEQKQKGKKAKPNSSADGNGSSGKEAKDDQILKIGVPYENETGVSYYLGYYPSFRTKISYGEAIIRYDKMFLPLDDCPERCNLRGACLKWANDLESSPECSCYHGFEVQY
jgi:hypothetical protein